MVLQSAADLKRGYSLLQRGYRLEKRLITNLGGISFLDCVEECLRTTRCLSVNYFQPAQFCEVNFESKDSVPKLFLTKTGWFYSERIDWDKDMTGPCSRSNCLVNEKIVPTSLGQCTCKVSDCGIPVNEGYSLETVQDGDGIGISKKMHVTCLEGFEKQGSGLFTCQSDGFWKADLQCIVEYKLPGCFEDSRKRVLESGPHLLQTNGRSQCASHCATLGSYSYFGLEVDDECFCGNDIRYNPKQVATRECDFPCRRNSEEMCGGYWKILIFSS
uniref:Uncharacterized protein LOC111116744 n=1 Tax=Crassostrea virginica TaxID=6565 RepID=A0A8B8C746_CRAVI|nr:uncharacterized protein LOC111116744 [Crassostrea virginica]